MLIVFKSVVHLGSNAFNFIICNLNIHRKRFNEDQQKGGKEIMLQ